ncbi:uncharacterized protein METZ01_LOCUS273455 [marine metagenome]|uniref:nucleoside-diphosphate kinase n=1 Tax=marine metagenome TaxID=408172 RepID=A0A382KCY1_9ZZZZ
MEKTLVLLKPDCLVGKVAGEVVARFEKAGYQIVACKMMQLDADILNEHYAHIVHLPVFPDISGFMGSRPVIAMILQGENVIQGVRELLGPTDSTQASAGTIRGDLGENKMRNIAHASDGPDTAEVEIKRFFSPEEVFDLLAE